MSEHKQDYEGAHEDARGVDSIIERHWGALVIAFGLVFVAVLAFYNPTAN